MIHVREIWKHQVCKQTKYIMSIEKLRKHFESHGKTDSWCGLANQFNILPEGSNKQRSDKVRRVFNSIKVFKPKSGTIIIPTTAVEYPVHKS